MDRRCGLRGRVCARHTSPGKAGASDQPDAGGRPPWQRMRPGRLPAGEGPPFHGGKDVEKERGTQAQRPGIQVHAGGRGSPRGPGLVLGGSHAACHVRAAAAPALRHPAAGLPRSGGGPRRRRLRANQQAQEQRGHQVSTYRHGRPGIVVQAFHFDDSEMTAPWPRAGSTMRAFIISTYRAPSAGAISALTA